jgi:hypothetical protein
MFVLLSKFGITFFFADNDLLHSLVWPTIHQWKLFKCHPPKWTKNPKNSWLLTAKLPYRITCSRLLPFIVTDSLNERMKCANKHVKVANHLTADLWTLMFFPSNLSKHASEQSVKHNHMSLNFFFGTNESEVCQNFVLTVPTLFNVRFDWSHFCTLLQFLFFFSISQWMFMNSFFISTWSGMFRKSSYFSETIPIFYGGNFIYEIFKKLENAFLIL